MKCLISIALLVAASGAWADDIPTFYRCGNVLSERPMPACADAVMCEQRLEVERAKKAAEKERAAQYELSRWLAKYPNPAAIERERQESLQQLRRSFAKNAARIAALEQERRGLSGACAFNDCDKAGRERLRQAIYENEAMLSVRRQMASSAPREFKRIDEQCDRTLAWMKELWKKAPIESLRAGTPAFNVASGR